jgi:hypothetical protein
MNQITREHFSAELESYRTKKKISLRGLEEKIEFMEPYGLRKDVQVSLKKHGPNFQEGNYFGKKLKGKAIKSDLVGNSKKDPNTFIDKVRNFNKVYNKNMKEIRELKETNEFLIGRYNVITHPNTERSSTKSVRMITTTFEDVISKYKDRGYNFSDESLQKNMFDASPLILENSRLNNYFKFVKYVTQNELGTNSKINYQRDTSYLEKLVKVLNEKIVIDPDQTGGMVSDDSQEKSNRIMENEKFKEEIERENEKLEKENEALKDYLAIRDKNNQKRKGLIKPLIRKSITSLNKNKISYQRPLSPTEERMENKKNKISHRNVINNLPPLESYKFISTEESSNTNKLMTTQDTQASTKRSPMNITESTKESLLKSFNKSRKEEEMPLIDNLELLKKQLKTQRAGQSASARNSIKILTDMVQRPVNKRQSVSNAFNIKGLTKKNKEYLENFLQLLGENTIAEEYNNIDKTPKQIKKSSLDMPVIDPFQNQKAMMDSKMMKIKNEKKTKTLEELYEKLKGRILGNHSIQELKNYFSEYTNKTNISDNDFE